MSTAALILPDFLLILAGFALRRLPVLGTEAWSGMERLTYFVLLPAVLFYANARASVDFAAAGSLVAAVGVALAAGIAFGRAGKPLFRPPERTFAAGFQCAFRFNVYVGLAVAGRVLGEAGLALYAIAIGVAVPISNAVAVWALARGAGRGTLREVLTNPMIVASVAGIAWGTAGLPLPELAQVTLSRLGTAAIVLGLLAVGAALDLRIERAHAGFLAWIVFVKLALVPAAVWLARAPLGLTREAFVVALAFAALPTASAAYILAVRLGGDARAAATVVSYSVALSMVTLPLWLALASGT
jgi:predicted permease